MNLKGKHLLCTQDWTVEELNLLLQLADDMRLNRFDPRFTSLLDKRSFFMFFYNPSVRTRQSFECAAIELGGAAQFLEPKSMRLKTKTSAGETVEDAAQVMSRYAAGLGIRILEDKLEQYGDGQKLLEEYCEWSKIPVVSMAHDKYHPCQGLADMLGYRTHLGNNLKGKKLLQVWGHGALARSWCSVQESLLICSRFGMDVTLAYPEGYDLDPEVIAATKANCEANGQKFEITNEPVDCYDGADVVYSRNWMSPQAYGPDGFDKQKEVEKSLKYPQWITDGEKMKRTNNAVYSHPMPIDRGHEVADEVASSDRSIIYDIAENRLHVQKAYMALTMSDFNYELKEIDYGQKDSCCCNRG
jgi:N-acetylornithine carbamoyltransferase